MITAIVIPADPTVAMRTEQLAPGGDWAHLVGGTMQVIAFEEPHASLYLNEEGKLRCLGFNARATAMTWVHNSAFRGRDIIVGDAFLVGPVDDHGDDQTVPEEYVRLLFEAPQLGVPEEYVRLLFEAPQLGVQVQAGDDTRWRALNVVLTAGPSAYQLAADFAHATPAVTEIRLVPHCGPFQTPARDRAALTAAYGALL